MVGRGSRRPRVVVAVGIAAMLSAPTAGCSYSFVNPPPPPEDRPPIVRCTSSDALPIVDMVLAGLQVVRTAFALSADDAVYAKTAIPRELDIGIGIGLSGIFLSSSVVGFRQTSKCREILANPEEPDQRPRVRRPPPRLTVGPPPLSPQKPEEHAEDAAVRARAADQAGAARADAGAPSEVDAGPAAPVVVPARTPEHSAPPVRQRMDSE